MSTEIVKIHHIPDAVKWALTSLDEAGVESVLAENFYDLIMYHLSYGMMLRNTLGLWEDESPLRDEFYQMFEELPDEKHQDACSQWIIEQMWCIAQIKLGKDPSKKAEAGSRISDKVTHLIEEIEL